MIAFLDANFAVAICGRSLVAGISATPITYCGRTPWRPTLPRNFVVDAVVAAEADGGQIIRRPQEIAPSRLSMPLSRIILVLTSLFCVVWSYAHSQVVQFRDPDPAAAVANDEGAMVRLNLRGDVELGP